LRIAKSNFLYGQLILDEFKLSELKAGNGWWANKFGIQAGIKTYKFLNIPYWFAQVEVNYIKPFTYTHTNSLENYGSYYQPLAHPLGANCKELILLTDFRKKRSNIRVLMIYSLFGSDTGIVNYGGDIYRSYNDNRNEYGNYTTQGSLNKLLTAEVKYSYLINPEWKMSFNIGYRFRNHYTTNNKTINHYVFIGITSNLYNYE
jgi:hypothetical protein